MPFLEQDASPVQIHGPEQPGETFISLSQSWTVTQIELFYKDSTLQIMKLHFSMK